MRDMIQNRDSLNAQLPLPPLENDENRRVELRFGLPSVDAAASTGGDGTWTRPGGPRGDAGLARARLADEARRWRALPDGKRSRLRGLLTQLDTTVVRARRSGAAAAIDDIEVALAALTAALDLGAEPHVMSCPTCGRLGMADATICGFCWTSLAPIA